MNDNTGMEQAKTIAARTRTEARSVDSQGRFVDLVAVITGASQRGIGGAVARQLLREGASVMLACREKPAQLLQQLHRDGSDVAWVRCDVCQPSDVHRLVDECLEAFGAIDILVNNAGAELRGPFGNLSEGQWQELVDVNLSAVVRLTRAMLPHLELRNGVVVNIASATALAGTAGLAGYSATKAALVGLTQSLALELAPQGIRVVGIAPAVVKTPMALRHAATLSAEQWEQIKACHPLGIGTPQDVASAVAFLASRQAKWITGVMLPMGWVPSFPLPAASG